MPTRYGLVNRQCGLDKLGDADLAWFEEPVHSASFDQVERLCKMTCKLPTVNQANLP
jgi:hypothetical protein